MRVYVRTHLLKRRIALEALSFRASLMQLLSLWTMIYSHCRVRLLLLHPYTSKDLVLQLTLNLQYSR